MRAHKITSFIFFIFFYTLGFSQNTKVSQATRQYNKFSYIKTSDILLKVANKGYKSVDLYQKLGNSYYFNNQMEDAVKWYKALMEMNEPIDPEYYFRYANALKFNENYEESDIWMLKFHENNKDDFRAKAFISKVNYLESIEALSDNITINNLDVNSELSDFGATQYKDQLVFSSSRNKDRKTYQWNDQPYLELYTATKVKNGVYNNAKLFQDKINTKYHESSASFTPNDSVIYFTRNNFFKSRKRADEEGINRLQIYKSQLNKDGTWEKETSIHFNSESYSVAHPSINVYGTRMYFSSDMPGSKGQSDIYMVDILKDGTLGEPINLAILNTEGQENFPFISENGDLYFSSNGLPGLGGLDIYRVEDFENRFKNKQPLIAKNVGKPINSPQDDFAYTDNLGTREAFFSSNRTGGKGDDDIYSFIIPECEQVIQGIVLDKITKEPLTQSTVTLFTTDGKVIQKVIVGSDVSFTFSVDCNQAYLIRGEQVTFIADEKHITTPKQKQKLDIELYLQPNEQSVKVGDDLAKALDIPIIYFDLDKYNIRYDAKIALQKVLEVLEQYPNMELEIRSHTDCRAPASYNQKLSDNRAKATRNYLIKKGIEASRLTATGYGESQLVNDCSCESKNKSNCTEAQHQQNRRSEFIIKAN